MNSLEMIAHLQTLHHEILTLANSVKELQVVVYQEHLDSTSGDVLD